MILKIVASSVICLVLASPNFADSINFKTILIQTNVLTQGAVPLSIASADFDRDGVADLISGYEIGTKGILLFHRGNVDAIYPNAPEAQQRKTNGTFINAPFYLARELQISSPPMFLAAGDFDADGNSDLAVAATNPSQILFLIGDGQGNFQESLTVPIQGTITAMTAGDVNFRDGLPDLVIGVEKKGNYNLLVFENPRGAMNAQPERLSLPSKAESILVARTDDDAIPDVAIFGENKFLMVHGRNRKLQWNTAQQKKVSAAIVEQIDTSSFVNFKNPIVRDWQARLTQNSESNVATLQMRLNGDAIPDTVVLANAPPSLSIRMSQPMNIYVVNTADDHDDGTCDASDCTLREAAIAANNNSGLDEIDFNIGSGQQTIQLGEGGITINDDVLIDGTTQPGFNGTPIIAVRGFDISLTVCLSIYNSTDVIRGLVIQNCFEAIGMFNSSSNNIIEGNFVGVDFSGTVPVPNSRGIWLENSSYNMFGGAVSAARNLIKDGLTSWGSTGHTIQGNFIGTDITGTVKLGAGSVNLHNESWGHTIGGVDSGMINVITGGLIIDCFDENCGSNVIQGNHIGVDVTGQIPIENELWGILLGVSGLNLIGGTQPGSGNLIETSSSGIIIEGIENVIQGNDIGNIAGNLSYGIYMRTSDSLIEDNIIRNNQRGIDIDPYPGNNFGNTITGNSIDNNIGLGIDLNNNDVVDVNDDDDLDEGANHTQNYPVLNDASSAGGVTTVNGSLSSKPNSAYILEFFASPQCDDSGFGEGETFFGTLDVTTDVTGDVAFNATFLNSLAGQVITSTATDIATGDTSEFSNCVLVAGVNCLFSDDFEDGTVDPLKWTILKPEFTEAGGDFVATPIAKKAVAVATGFAGCGSGCTIDSFMQTNGGLMNKVWLLAFYIDKKNTIEVLMNEEKDQWILRQRVNGKIVVKSKGSATINPNQSYHIELSYDGTNVTLVVDGTSLASVNPIGALSGTVGYQVKNTTGRFANVCAK